MGVGVPPARAAAPGALAGAPVVPFAAAAARIIRAFAAARPGSGCGAAATGGRVPAQAGAPAGPAIRAEVAAAAQGPVGPGVGVIAGPSARGVPAPDMGPALGNFARRVPQKDSATRKEKRKASLFGA